MFACGLANGSHVHEADHALVVGESEQPRNLAVVGCPSGQPLRAETQCLCTQQQVVCHATRRQHLLLFGNFVIAQNARNDHHDQRRVQISLTILGQHRSWGIRLLARVDLREPFAKREACLTLTSNKRVGERRPWSGTRMAAVSNVSNSKWSGPGSPNWREGTDKR